MNVNSSTATSTTSTTQNSSSTRAQGNASVSFEEEMQTAQNQEQDVQKEEAIAQNNDELKQNQNNNENNTQENTNLLNGKVEVDENIDAKLNTQNLLSLNIQQLINTQNELSNKTPIFNIGIFTNEDITKNIGQTLDYSSIDMTKEDAKFFVDIVKNNNAGIQNIAQDIQQALEFGTEEIQKTANISKTLLNALQNSAKTGQAVRIDFGNDVAVVMRINRDGSIMANFIPGDKAVEEYLKNNIGFLKQRFDEEDVKYSQLSYSQHQQQNREQNKNNKENKHE